MKHLTVPDLSLSRSQVLWALSLGREPAQAMVSQMRHLVASGIPFGTDKDLGRGNRRLFNFHEYIETGLALHALRHGMVNREVVKYLTSQRADLRKAFTSSFQEQPAAAIEHEWVKSRGKLVPTIAKARFLRMHNRFHEKPGQIDYVTADQLSAQPNLAIGDLQERFEDGTEILVPYTRLMLEWTGWALEAPEFKTGPGK